MYKNIHERQRTTTDESDGNTVYSGDLKMIKNSILYYEAHFQIKKEYSKFILIHLKYNQRENSVNMFENFIAASVHFIKMKKKSL